MKWWEDDKVQMILNTYWPRRRWLVAERSRAFVEEQRRGRSV
jgi:hypothetical protein